jgi:putative autotransporter adhesin-like protein
MKKRILMIASLVVMSILSFAGTKTPPVTATRNWSVDEPFDAISAKGNIEVILVADNSKTISLEGMEKHVNAVHLQVENGVLTITGPKGYCKKRTTVFVPVSELNNVVLRGGANVSSKGRLQSKNLHVRIEGTSTVNLRNLGDIVIESDELHQFNYEKSERSVIRLEREPATVSKR